MLPRFWCDGIEQYAYGEVTCIDHVIAKGIHVSDEDDVFKSYYQDD